MSVTSIIKSAKLPESRVSLCLRGDLQAEWDALEERRTAVLRADSVLDRMAPDPAAMAAVSEIEAEQERLRGEMAAATLTFHMRGLPPAVYNGLQATAGPPRQGNAVDKQFGFNFAAFAETVVKRCCVKVTTADGDEAELSDEDWTALLEAITDGQFDVLWECARNVNRQAPAPPTGR